MLLKDKVAIVTGGASGIGRAIVFKFVEHGCSCVIADIDEKRAAELLEKVQGPNKNCVFVKCDVSSVSQIRQMVQETLKKFGKVDILVNNAGTGLIKEIPREGRGIAYVNEAYWDKMIAINLKGAVFCCKEVVPHMIQNRYGKIINISSMGVFSPPAPSVEYHAAKAGILGLTFDLAFELAPYNINVNAILPGPIRTPFWDPVVAQVHDPDAFFERLAKKAVPLQRIGTPEDIANAALFFASELSSYITGAILPVSGGIPLPTFRFFIQD